MGSSRKRIYSQGWSATKGRPHKHQRDGGRQGGNDAGYWAEAVARSGRVGEVRGVLAVHQK